MCLCFNMQCQQSIGILIHQGLEQNTANDREHDCCGAGPDGQGQDRKQRESGPLPQRAKGDANILKKTIHRFHSYRKATMGSTFVARLTGTRVAATTSNITNTTTDKNVAGSFGVTSKSRLLSTRVKTIAPMS